MSDDVEIVHFLIESGETMTNEYGEPYSTWDLNMVVGRDRYRIATAEGWELHRAIPDLADALRRAVDQAKAKV